MDLGEGLREPASLGPFFFPHYIHHFGSPKPSASIQLTTIQPKNLTKIIKTFTIVIVLYIYIYKKLFYHQRTKKSYVIGETKTNFFTTIVNWYKYQLTIASC